MKNMTDHARFDYVIMKTRRYPVMTAHVSSSAGSSRLTCQMVNGLGVLSYQACSCSAAFSAGAPVAVEIWRIVLPRCSKHSVHFFDTGGRSQMAALGSSVVRMCASLSVAAGPMRRVLPACVISLIALSVPALLHFVLVLFR